MPTPNYDIFDVLHNAFGTVEPITLRLLDQITNTYTEYTSIDGFARSFNEVVIDPAGTQMVVSRVTWHLKGKDVTAASLPRAIDRGDQIVSVSEFWTGSYAIFEADLVAVGTRYKCETQKLLS